MDRMNASPVEQPAPEPDVLVGVRALARAAEDADGDPPFSEQTLIDLRTAPERAALALAPDPDDSIPRAAAVVLAAREAGAPALLEAVVRPEHRGAGLGRAVVETALSSADGPVDAWSHGDHPAARALAGALGFEPVRELHRLLRTTSADDEQPAVELPDGVVIRPFEVGADEQELLRVNAAAFADHPEQGQLSLADLREREAEDWFDPAGLLLAVEREDPARILGFHWTKRHPASGGEPARGEVYVVGVDPEQQGRSLGRALTAAGLRHLGDQGLAEILLYVDAENRAAFGLYESMGFGRWHVDVMFSRA
ncbi:mycothiol synthase [Kocuria palustris]|uniref:mycothiol synthase n=1 Tax=Kocuria palustris TaxID=71999 RepID=UPI0011A54F22|nr:mycothiol synthase [Kocuria palustris]